MSEHEAYERALREIESSIRSAADEIAHVADPDGTIAIQQEGGHDYVDLPADVLRGRTVIHNHPGGTSLSVEDVRTLIETGALEMRVVTATHRYSLRVPSNEITSSEARLRFMHEVWTEVSDILDWNYTREEWT